MTRSRWPRRENVAHTGSWVSKWPKRCAVKGADDAKTLASTACGCACQDVCDPSEENLADYEVWRREEGYWYGEYECGVDVQVLRVAAMASRRSDAANARLNSTPRRYTFLGAEGDPYVSSSWNYPYDHYYGFIHIELDGNSLKQRNVFIYPPQTAEKCEADDSTEGDGVCGTNGNEKVFGADQEASDCEGNLAGPYTQGGFTLDTTTKVLGDDTVIYSVKIPDSMGGGINQNQLTTLPGNGVRVRTAQGFSFGVRVRVLHAIDATPARPETRRRSSRATPPSTARPRSPRTSGSPSSRSLSLSRLWAELLKKKNSLLCAGLWCLPFNSPNPATTTGPRGVPHILAECGALQMRGVGRAPREPLRRTSRQWRFAPR